MRRAATAILASRPNRPQLLDRQLYCWVALDRAIRLAPRIGASEHVPRWAVERDRIRKAISD